MSCVVVFAWVGITFFLLTIHKRFLSRAVILRKNELPQVGFKPTTLCSLDEAKSNVCIYMYLASSSKLTSELMFILRECILRMCARASTVGAGNSILRSNRPDGGGGDFYSFSNMYTNKDKARHSSDIIHDGARQASDPSRFELISSHQQRIHMTCPVPCRFFVRTYGVQESVLVW